jgi:RelB Antitoxin alpha helical domain
MKIEDYPLAKELIFDAEGNISQVILNYTDYQYLIEAIEERGLLLAMREVKDEKPLTLQQALRELEQE